MSQSRLQSRWGRILIVTLAVVALASYVVMVSCAREVRVGAPAAAVPVDAGLPPGDAAQGAAQTAAARQRWLDTTAAERIRGPSSKSGGFHLFAPPPQQVAVPSSAQQSRGPSNNAPPPVQP